MERIRRVDVKGRHTRRHRLHAPEQPRRQQRAEQDDGDEIKADGPGRSQLRFGGPVKFLGREHLVPLDFIVDCFSDGEPGAMISV